MTLSRLIATTISVLNAAVLAAAEHGCPAPQRPAIPDGEQATEQQLLDARTQLAQFLTEANKYLLCLRDYEKQLGEKNEETDGHALVVDYNHMVDQMYLAGDEFNIALRRYRLIHEKDEGQ